MSEWMPYLRRCGHRTPYPTGTCAQCGRRLRAAVAEVRRQDTPQPCGTASAVSHYAHGWDPDDCAAAGRCALGRQLATAGTGADRG